MEPSVELFVPARLYARIGWAALGGSLISIFCGYRAPLAFLPAFLCAATALGLFWLASQPAIRVTENQFNIGDRTIAWREVTEVNSSRFVSPLVLHLRLTNNRKKLLVYPGEPEQIAQLVTLLHKHAHGASFDGIAYKDYWTSLNVAAGRNDKANSDQPVRMLSPEDEEEVERLYQKLKAVGRLDSRSSDSNED